jgi:hypothetical protein
VNIAEPNALIGFAGARVSAGTIAQELPEGFQRSEFLYAHGFLDRVVHRTELRAEVAALLGFLEARPAAGAEEEPIGDVLGLPSFRPLSFLSNLAERVMQTEPEPTVPTDGNGTGPDVETRPPAGRASGAKAVELDAAAAEVISTPEPDEPTSVDAEPVPAAPESSPPPVVAEPAAPTEEPQRG